MTEKQRVSEEMNVHKEWYEKAKQIKSTEQAKQFADNLMSDFHHDYGTICHAIASSTLGMFNSLAHEAGITGFQASCITWEVMRVLFYLKGGAKLLKYEDMLFPQYDYKFEKSISKDTFEWLRKEAQERLKENNFMHPNVKAHMQSIVDGKAPFGFTISDKD